MEDKDSKERKLESASEPNYETDNMDARKSMGKWNGELKILKY